MNRERSPLFVVAMFVACAGSLALGFYLGRRVAPAERTIAVNPGEAAVIHSGVDGSGNGGGESEALKRADSLEKRLKVAEAELAALRGRAPKPDAAAGASLETLRAQIDPLYKAHRGRDLLILMNRFAALGELGYPDALAIWKLLREAEKASAEQGDDAPDFDISGGEIEEAMGQTMQGLLRWGILNPDLVTADFRLSAAAALSSESSSWADPKEFLELLRVEKDDLVASHLAAAMGTQHLSEEMIPALEEAMRAHTGNRQATQLILRNIADIQGDVADARLLALSKDPDATVRESASFLVVWRHPGGTGALIGESPGNYSSIDVRSGDIIVSIGDAVVGTGEHWNEQMARLKETDGNVIVTSIRDGQVVTSAVPAKDLSKVWAFSFVREQK